MRFESLTRHVFSPAYIPIYHVTYNVNCFFFFSLKPIFTFIYFMHRNAMHIERIEVGVYTIISPLSIDNRI